MYVYDHPLGWRKTSLDYSEMYQNNLLEFLSLLSKLLRKVRVLCSFLQLFWKLSGLFGLCIGLHAVRRPPCVPAMLNFKFKALFLIKWPKTQKRPFLPNTLSYKKSKVRFELSVFCLIRIQKSITSFSCEITSF